MEVDWRFATGVAQVLLDINNDTASNRVYIEKTSSNNLDMVVFSDGSIVNNQGQSASAYSGIQKIAYAYKTDDFELYRNGSSISANTSGSLASLGTLSFVDFGQSRASTSQANMWIRAVALYKTRLTNDQLADLTS